MNIQEIRKLLAENELEKAAELSGYNSPKLQKYMDLEDKPKSAQEHTDYLDLGDEIVREILELIK